MDTNELISVIIPVYNVEPYLRECIDSVIVQGYKKLEIICVNDGSTDSSPEILEEYKKKDDRIVIINQENAGLSAARNTGLMASRGEYVYFLDSDDLIKPEAMGELLDLARSNGLDILQFDSELLFEDESVKSEFSELEKYYHRRREYTSVKTGRQLYSLMSAAGDYRPNAVLQFFRRNFLKDNDLWFFEGILHEDELFTFLAMLKAEKALHVSKAYYLRRMRRNSIMTVPKSYANFKGYFTCYVEMFRFAQVIKMDPDTEHYAWRRIDLMRRTAFDIYSKLPYGEKVGINWTDDALTNQLFSMSDYLLAERLRKDNEAIVNSKSYRIGRMITSPVKITKDWKRIYSRLRAYSKEDPEIFTKTLSLLTKPGKRIFLIGTPVHGNLGDHAIALSERDYFKQYFPKYVFVDCTMPFAINCMDLLKSWMRKDDIICVSGGGWLGTIARHNENFVRRVIRTFPDNPIVILPQTVFYQDDIYYSIEGSRIYESHPRLLFCVREENSYNYIIDNHFVKKNRAFLMPDFVLLYHGYNDYSEKRDNIVNICLRDDNEKVINSSKSEDIFEAANSFATVRKLTTHLGTSKVSTKGREKAVLTKLSEVSKGRLLITDRLHAMIFAAITGTPCLAIDNATHKVRGVYKWINKLDYIRLASDDESIEEQVNRFKEIEPGTGVSSLGLETYEVELKKRIMEMVQ